MSKTEDIKKEIKNRVYEWIIDPASWLNNEKECEDYLNKLLDKLVKNDVVLDGGINCDHDYRRAPNSNNPFKCINCGKLRGQ